MSWTEKVLHTISDENNVVDDVCELRDSVYSLDYIIGMKQLWRVFMMLNTYVGLCYFVDVEDVLPVILLFNNIVKFS